MADFLSTIFGQIEKRYKDMGDGTHAEVVSLGDSPAVAIDGDVGVNATVVVPTAPYHGVVTVASAGTAVALSATSQALQAGVQVRAHIGNTGLIYVGGDTVAAANGYRLAQGESVFLSIADLADVYVDAAENGDAVSFLAS